MATKALTKEQKKAQRAEERNRRAARMRKELGETITRKVALGLGGYATGLAPNMGPARTSTVATVLGWGGALAFNGKVAAAAEGIGDAGFAVMSARWGAEKRVSLAADHFLRGEFFEASGDARAPEVRAVERRAFAAGRVAGLRDGVRGAVGRMQDVGVAETAGVTTGVPSSAAELVEGQVAEVMDGQ